MNNKGNSTDEVGRERAIDRILAGDKALWVVVVTLLIYSIFVVYSTMSYSRNPNIQASQALIKQFTYIFIGSIALFMAMMVNLQKHRKAIFFIYLAALALTLIMVLTHSGSGVARSLNLFGFDFQPFEILKIAVVLLLADTLARRQKFIDKIDLIPSLNPRDWDTPEKRAAQIETFKKHTLPIFMPVVLACCVTLKTSNSTTFLIFASCFIMLVIGRARAADLKRMLLLAVVVGGAAFLILGARQDTFQGRVGNYNPNLITPTYKTESDGLDYYVQTNEKDQTMYAKMSVATGRLFGKGAGQSTNRLLSEADKDMVYAFLIEEYGFVFGGLVILMAFLILFYRTIEIFKKCGTAFSGLVVLGLGMMMVLQAMIHMAVSVSLIPITGQQLPIVSRGGSSLLFTMISLGLILGISAQAERKTLEQPKDETILEK